MNIVICPCSELNCSTVPSVYIDRKLVFESMNLINKTYKMIKGYFQFTKEYLCQPCIAYHIMLDKDLINIHNKH